MSDEYVLEMRQICKRFGGTLALDNVDFAVNKGEVHASSGGKTVLVRAPSSRYSVAFTLLTLGLLPSMARRLRYIRLKMHSDSE